MKSKIDKIVLGLVLGLMVNGLSAQQWLGNALSNHSGTNGVYTNPATLGGNRYKVYVNGFGAGFNATNDYVSYDAPFSLRDLATNNVPNQYKDSTGSVQFQSSWLNENINGKNKNVYFEIEARGPAVMYRLNKKMGVSFQTRSRTAISLTNVSEELARIMVNGLDTSKPNPIYQSPGNLIIGQNVDNLRIRFNALSYQEYGASFGMQLPRIAGFRIKVGATAKFLMGNGYAYAQGDNLDFQINATDSIRINNADFGYGYSDPNNITNFTPASLIPSRNGDYGLGFDAGAIIEFDPKATEGITSKKTNYLFKVGLSLIDMGGINFRGNAVGRKISTKAPFTFIPDSTTEAALANGPTSTEAIAYYDSLVDQHFNVTSVSPVRYNLPTMLSVQLDYNIFKSFYVGAIWYQDVRGIKLDKIALHRPSQVSIIPRFESKLIEVALPVSLNSDYKLLQMGAYAKLGPFFIGTDNLGGVISPSKIFGVNTYFGVAYGIGKNKDKKREAAKKEANSNFDGKFNNL